MLSEIRQQRAELVPRTEAEALDDYQDRLEREELAENDRKAAAVEERRVKHGAELASLNVEIERLNEELNAAIGRERRILEGADTEEPKDNRPTAWDILNAD